MHSKGPELVPSGRMVSDEQCADPLRSCVRFPALKPWPLEEPQAPSSCAGLGSERKKDTKKERQNDRQKESKKD